MPPKKPDPKAAKGAAAPKVSNPNAHCLLYQTGPTFTGVGRGFDESKEMGRGDGKGQTSCRRRRLSLSLLAGECFAEVVAIRGTCRLPCYSIRWRLDGPCDDSMGEAFWPKAMGRRGFAELVVWLHIRRGRCLFRSKRGAYFYRTLDAVPLFETVGFTTPISATTLIRSPPTSAALWSQAQRTPPCNT